VAAPK